jgi:hypothetical protein
VVAHPIENSVPMSSDDNSDDDDLWPFKKGSLRTWWRLLLVLFCLWFILSKFSFKMFQFLDGLNSGEVRNQ